MVQSKFTKEESDWLKLNGPKHTGYDITILFNKTFNKDYEQSVIVRKCKGLKAHVLRTGYINWTPEEDKWLKKYSSSMSRKELHKLFIQQFREVNFDAFKGHCINNKFYTLNDSKFQKGHRSWQTGLKGDAYRKHFTEETYNRSIKQVVLNNRKHHVNDIYNRGGRLRILISEESGKGPDRRSISYNKYLYEKHYGITLEKDECVINLDGDIYNTSIENLYKINKQTLMLLNKYSIKGAATAAMLSILETEKLLKEMENL